MKRGKICALHQQGFDLQGIADMTGALTGCELEIDYFLKDLDKEQDKQSEWRRLSVASKV